MPPPTAKPPTSAEPEAIRNLMVNYIPTTIDEVQLRQLFEMYGPIESVKIVCDRETRTSKGYGFVKYRFAFSAVHAIQYLNGYPLMNKRLKVAYSNQAEAQKALIPPAVDPQQYGGQYGGVQQPPQQQQQQQQAPDEQWAAQQLSYMQHLAALQMMQASAYGAPAGLAAPHAQMHQHSHAHMHQHRHHQHHHHAPQQPQQPQAAEHHHQ